MTFAEDLARFGPHFRGPISLAEAQRYCARLTARHYENFHVVTWLTPRELRPAFQSIYAFCRWSDDLGDELGDPERSRELLSWWRDELDRVYQGQPRHPVMLALAEVVREYAIPIEPFSKLISAFEQDQVVTDYQDYEQLRDYCTRSANPVGHLVLYLGRVYDEERARLSDLTCTALQLANFWQDVARDLAIGRIYLPREDRERFGVGINDLRSDRASPAFKALLAFEVDRTRLMFQQGWPLIEQIPRPLAVDIDLFTRGGLAILDKIRDHDYDVLAARPRLTKWDKARLLGTALVGRVGWRPQPARSGRLATPASAREN